MDLFTMLLEKNIDVLKASDHADCKAMSVGTWKESPAPTLLHESTWLRETSIVAKLVQAGWDVDIVYLVPDGKESRYKYSTALHDATRQGSISIVKILVNAGCRLKGVFPASLQSPAHEATKLRESEIADILIKAGADPVECLADEKSEAVGRKRSHYEVDNLESSWSRIFQEQMDRAAEDRHLLSEFDPNLMD
jgi:ankyrin repeat protein